MGFWGIPEEVGGKLEFFQGYHHLPATSAHTLPKAKGAGGSRPLGSQVSSNGTKMETPGLPQPASASPSPLLTPLSHFMLASTKPCEWPLWALGACLPTPPPDAQPICLSWLYLPSAGPEKSHNPERTGARL